MLLYIRKSTVTILVNDSPMISGLYSDVFLSGDWFVWAKSILFVFQHAHVSMAEVIGLLGGRYSEADKIVEVSSLL